MLSVFVRILIASSSLALVCLTACSSSPHDPAEKYVLIAAGTKIQYWQTAAAGLRHAVAEMAVKGEVDGPDTRDPHEEQAAFRRAVAGKPSGILVSVADASLLVPEINAAVDRGIPVITIDSDAPDSKRFFFVGTENYRAGEVGGNLAAQLLHGKGNVIVFKLPNQTNQDSRLSGYRAAFDPHSDIKVTRVIDLQDEPDRSALAYDATKGLINDKTKVDAFVCLESRACGGVADAVTRANLSGKTVIIAMDTDPETLDWIQKGAISATIAQRPFTMAYVGTKLLDDLHHRPLSASQQNWVKSPYALLPAFVNTGSFIIDKKSVASFQEQTKSENQ